MEITREVEFNGAKLLAVKIEYKYYVSMRHICNGLKLTESQRKYIVNKFNKDETLKGGKKIYPLVTNGGIQNTSLIELDYLPLWLAKINPARFSKELKDKLLEYQLHAKEVLAAAFLDKPKQLTLPKPKEHKIIKKYYNGVPVMFLTDLMQITGFSKSTIYYYISKNKTLVNKSEVAAFKLENPNIYQKLSNVTIFYKEEVINICKKMKVYDKVKPQILAYFDDFIPEAENKLSDDIQEVITDQNKKAELLLQVLPYIDEKSLKGHIAATVIKLIDNKILEEYKNENLHMRFIDSTEKIIEVSETPDRKVTVVKTDKPIEEFRTPGLVVTEFAGYKYIIEEKK